METREESGCRCAVGGAAHTLNEPPGNEYLRLWVRLRPQAGSAPFRRGRDPRMHGLCSTVVRRALGNTLVKRFCPHGDPQCQPKGGTRGLPVTELCQLAAHCPYGVLYARSLNPRPPLALHVPQWFHRDGKGTWASGEPGVELTFFGAACGLYAWTLQALEHTLHQGLGKARSRWEIAEVVRRHSGHPPERLCGSDLRDLPPVLAPRQLGLATALDSSAETVPGQAGGRVEVRFESPTRLTRAGRLLKGSEPVPLDLLVARILERFAALYGDNADPWLAPEVRRQLEEGARGAALLEDSTRWLEVTDYSARTRKEMLMGGKVGRLVYDGMALPFLPVLRAGEVLHVGKNPAFGCGRLGVSVV